MDGEHGENDGVGNGIAPLNNTKFSSYIDRNLNLDPPGSSNVIKKAVDNEDSNNDDEEEEEESSSNFELWTFRIPTEMNIQDLHGVELVLNNCDNADDDDCNKKKEKRKNINKKNRFSSMKESIPINDNFILTEGISAENENFRVLVPCGGDTCERNKEEKDSNGSDSSSSSSSSSSDDDDDNDNGKSNSIKKDITKFLLRPSSKSFTRHYNITTALYPQRTEMELAPRIGPDPPTDTKLRHAYSSISQRTGLKRRWMPLSGAAHDRSKQQQHHTVNEIPIEILNRASTKKKKNEIELPSTTTATNSNTNTDTNCAVSTPPSREKKRRNKKDNGKSSRSKISSSSKMKKKRKVTTDNNDDGIINTPPPRAKRIKSEHNNTIDDNHNDGGDNYNKNSTLQTLTLLASAGTTASSKEERRSHKKSAKKTSKKKKKKVKQEN